MIITCEKCFTKFNLDESLLKENGSKVRCCLCSHVFTAYPPAGEEKNGISVQSNDQAVLTETEKSCKPLQEAENDSNGEINVTLPHEDLLPGDEPEFEDNLDLDNEEDFDLEFDFDDDFETEAGLELEDIEAGADFEDNSGKDITEEDKTEQDSTEFDFFSGEDEDSVDNFEIEFDEKFGSDFDSENKEIASGIKDGEQTSEGNFELELSFGNVDASVDELDEPVDGLELDGLKEELTADNSGNDDISIDDEDTIEFDFSELDEEAAEDSALLSAQSVHEDAEEISPHEKAESENMPENMPENMKDEQSLPDTAGNVEESPSDSASLEFTLSDSMSPDSTAPLLDTKQKNIPEHEEPEDSTLGAIPDGFESEKELKKSAKKLGKSVFVILFLAIIILAGYSISIMKGINIPYVSTIKIPFLTQYLTTKPRVTPSPADLNLIPDKKSINGRFVNNSSAGTLFVITGKIINKSKISYSHVRVTGTLITKDKIKVNKKIVFCGNPIPEDKLRSLKMKDINIMLDKKNGSNSSNVNIEPGRSVPFMIVFSNLPDNLANFTVNVAGFDKEVIKK